MRYYAQYNDSKALTAIGTGAGGGTEITKAEYNELLTMTHTKSELVDKLYNGEITISDVPTEWQEEIQRRVDERIEMEGQAEEQEISSDEFYNMVEGVL